jgi:hypothetical protein
MQQETSKEEIVGRLGSQWSRSRGSKVATYQTKEKNHSIDLLMLKIGAKSIARQGMIWRSAEPLWIARRCHRNQRHMSRDVENINELIPIMMISSMRST